jgi:hypothetical protein
MASWDERRNVGAPVPAVESCPPILEESVPDSYARRKVSSVISGGTPRRMGAPMVPRPRLT